MELVAQDVVKLLRPRSTRLTIVPRPAQLSQDVGVLTRPSFVSAFSPPSQPPYSTFPQNDKSLRGVSTTTNTSQQPTNISSLNKEVYTTKSVHAEPRPIWTTVTTEEDENPGKVHGKVAKKSTLQDQEVDKRAAEEE